METLEIKNFCGMELKADTGKSIIEGYASVYGNVDSHNDIMVEGCFNKSINDWKRANPKNRRIKVLSQHNWDEPIGIPLDLKSDKMGLYTVSKISKTQEGEKMLILASDGVVNEMSVGFYTVKRMIDDEKGVRKLLEVALMEYSPVTWGSNQLTSIDDVKSMIKQYSYSKGNVLEIFADVLLDKVKTLSIGQEPTQKVTLEGKKSLEIDDVEIEELLQEIKSMKEGS